MKLKIEKTTGLVLEGNTISGNTYPVKDFIKSYLNGKWDSNRKGWIVDVEKVNDMLSKGGSAYTGFWVDDGVPTAKPRKATGTAATNGWCDLCHSYCWGDCTA